jgi:glycosyltransferase involved in cell wall biosynthesis
VNIDILVNCLRGGGAERVAANLADGWHEAGRAVRVIINEPLHLVEYRMLPGVELVSLAANTTSAATRLMRLRKMLKDRRADVVVAVQANMAIEAALATTGLGLSIIGCEHNTPGRSVRGRVWSALRPFAYRRLSAITTLTSGAAEDLRRLCPGTYIDVVPNILRLPLADNEPRLSPADLVPAGAPLLLAAGRFVEAKGFDRMVANFARLAKRVTDVRLVILGDGPLRPRIAEDVEARGLSGRIVLPGRAGNMADWYRRASLYLMTSRWEGLPMVMIESMAHGLPVVATDFRYGPRDVIRDGIDGRILPEGHPDAWSAAVEELLKDNALRSSMARHAVNVAVRFDATAVLSKWQDLFDRVLVQRNSK